MEIPFVVKLGYVEHHLERSKATLRRLRTGSLLRVLDSTAIRRSQFAPGQPIKRRALWASLARLQSMVPSGNLVPKGNSVALSDDCQPAFNRSCCVNESFILASMSRLGRPEDDDPKERTTGGDGRAHMLRRAQRFMIEVLVRYRVSGETNWTDGWTQDISTSGMLFRSERSLEPDTPIDVRFELLAQISNQPGAEVNCRGRIVRATPPRKPETSYTLAAVFVDHHFVRRASGPVRQNVWAK